jgi:hypothetical protein
VREMWKIRKWFEKKTVSKQEYDDEKREFEMAIGRPFITLKVELPEGFEDQRAEFMNLEKNPEFIDQIEDLVKKNLLYSRKTGEAEPQSDA